MGKGSGGHLNNGAAQTVAARGIKEDVSGLLALLWGWRGGSALDPAVMAASPDLPTTTGKGMAQGLFYFLSGIFTGPPIWQVALSCAKGRHISGCASSFSYINKGNLCLSWGGISVQLPLSHAQVYNLAPHFPIPAATA